MTDYAKSKCRITEKMCSAWSEAAGCGLVRCKFVEEKGGDEGMTDRRKGCPMRHENGNCTVAGGFCTAVNNPICEALHNAFDCGYLSALRQQETVTKCNDLFDEDGGEILNDETVTDRHQMTNAQKIRSMSDEEIADWVSVNGAIKTPCDIICGGDCKAIATIEKSSIERCKEIVMKWLQMPAEDDHDA